MEPEGSLRHSQVPATCPCLAFMYSSTKYFLCILYLNLLPIFPIPKSSLQALRTKIYCAVKPSGYIAPNCRMTHALEEVWKEPAVACFQVLCRRSAGDAE